MKTFALLISCAFLAFAGAARADVAPPLPQESALSNKALVAEMFQKMFVENKVAQYADKYFAEDFHRFDWLGQFVSIPMNWRTGFEKRSQFLIGWKRVTNCVVAHRSPLRCFSNAVVGSNGSKESPPQLFSVQNSCICHGQVIQRRSRSSV